LEYGEATFQYIFYKGEMPREYAGLMGSGYYYIRVPQTCKNNEKILVQGNLCVGQMKYI
jgi:hypothetical protein